MTLVTPTISTGGIRLALAMPNLTPPITTVAQAMEYKKKLMQLSPKTTFLMTLYLCEKLYADEIYKAKDAGIGDLLSIYNK